MDEANLAWSSTRNRGLGKGLGGGTTITTDTHAQPALPVLPLPAATGFPRPPHLLMVEDEPDTALPLVRTLEREGYLVSWVETGRDALAHLARHPADVVVLDLGLPDIDGLDVCRSARSEGYDGGVLMVTGRATEADRVAGLDRGADDYLVKPFGLAELHARVRAVLRRTGRAEPADRAAELVVDHQGGARVGGTELALGPREQDVLRLLAEHRGRVVARAVLMDAVWSSGWDGSPKILDMTVARLRQKLARAGAAARIVAVRGVGFRLDD